MSRDASGGGRTPEAAAAAVATAAAAAEVAAAEVVAATKVVTATAAAEVVTAEAEVVVATTTGATAAAEVAATGRREDEYSGLERILETRGDADRSRQERRRRPLQRTGRRCSCLDEWKALSRKNEHGSRDNSHQSRRWCQPGRGRHLRCKRCRKEAGARSRPSRRWCWAMGCRP